MNKELELWQFILDRLLRNESAMLLVVAESSGSSPGRQGYKMAVAEDGELAGSIGGGVMEVDLVEQSRETLSQSRPGGLSKSTIRNPQATIKEQVHRKDAINSSGMICSGKQTVIFKLLSPSDATTVDSIISDLKQRTRSVLTVGSNLFGITELQRSTTPSSKDADIHPVDEGSLRSQRPDGVTQNSDFTFEKLTDQDFRYTEKVGAKNELYIIGGGHCALALSGLMSKMDFHVSLFDDRPELNTIAKNEYADVIKIVDSYDRIGDHIPSGESAYVVVMTLGYKTDEIVIRDLIDKEFKYFGVLGSKAKMSAMFRSLKKDRICDEKLDRIRTPVGLPINSRTPEEIAVSIAAEIVSVKNG